MSSVSSTTSSLSYSSLYEKLNSSSKVTTTTTAKSFSASISKSDSDLSIIEEFNSNNNISDDPFFEILSEDGSLRDGTVKTNISSLIANSSNTSISTGTSIDTLI